MSSIYKPVTGGGGGVPITQINGDSGSITGSIVTIFANNVTQNSGSSVKFVNSGTVSTFNVSDASLNTIIGKLGGNATLSGTVNTGLGVGVFTSLTTGFANNAWGHNSLNKATSGSSNNAFGNLSLDNLLTGTNNIAIGVSAGGALTSSESSNILIGNQGTLGQSNAVKIGFQGSGVGEQNLCFIAGITGATPTSANTPQVVLCDNSANLATISSSTAGFVLTSNGAATPSFQASAGGGVAGTAAFLAYLSGSLSNITGDGTFATLTYNTTAINNGTNFDTLNNWYHVPVTGGYQFSVNNILTNSAGTNTGIFVTLNNAAQVYFLTYNGVYNSTTTTGTANASITIPCTAGDNIFIQIAVSGNVSKNVSVTGGNQGFTSFSGFRVY